MDTLALQEGKFGVTFCQPSRDSEGWVESFVVHIVEPGLSATARVDNSRFIPGPETLFRDLAENWQGWNGEKTWNALERELALSATSDLLGHVTIRVQLQPTAGPDGWRVFSYAYLEAGQLETLSARASKFFAREL